MKGSEPFARTFSVAGEVRFLAVNAGAEGRLHFGGVCAILEVIQPSESALVWLCVHIQTATAQ